MKTYSIYCHVFPNGKIYFGQSCNCKKRWGTNGKGYGNSLVGNAIKKYGWDNIQHIIISSGLDKEEADFLEIFYIQSYNTTDRQFGYNITRGGNTTEGFRFTEEQKKKMSEKRKGIPKSEAMKENNRISNLGVKHNLSDEGRQILVQNGKKAHHDNFSGHSHSEEAKLKISLASSGENNGMFGKAHTEQSKQKMSAAKKGKHRVWNEEHTKYHYEF